MIKMLMTKIREFVTRGVTVARERESRAELRRHDLWLAARSPCGRSPTVPSCLIGTAHQPVV
jgi:hypothetical protein